MDCQFNTVVSVLLLVLLTVALVIWAIGMYTTITDKEKTSLGD